MRQKTLLRRDIHTYRRMWWWHGLGVALGVFLACLWYAPTRGITQFQVQMISPVGLLQPENLKEKPDHLRDPSHKFMQVAEMYRNDPAIQLAYRLINSLEMRKAESVSSTSVVHASDLMSVVKGFPNDPMTLATCLRYVQNFELLEKYGYKYFRHENSNAYYQMAVRGERADPENGFFSAMQALYYILNFQDKLAVEALDRAAHKPKWNDYVKEEKFGRLRLLTLGIGNMPATTRFLFTQYPFSSAPKQGLILSQKISLLASQREMAGDAGAGIALRSRMMRVAVRVMEQGDFREGKSMFFQSAAFLIGVSPANHHVDDTFFRNMSQRENLTDAQLMAQYVAHLRKYNYPGEADWANSYLVNVNEWNSLVHTDYPNTVYSTLSWLGNLFLMGEISVFLVCCAAASVWLYGKRFQATMPRPIQGVQAGGMALGMGIIVWLILFGLIIGSVSNPTIAFLPAVALQMLVIMLIGMLVPRLRALLFTAILTVVTISVPLYLFLLQTRGMVNFLFDTFANVYPSSYSYDERHLWLSYTLYIVLSLLAFPALLAVIGTLHGVVRQTPVAQHVARLFSRAAVPVMTVLLLVYTSSVVVTMVREREVESAIRQVINQGRMDNIAPHIFIGSQSKR